MDQSKALQKLTEAADLSGMVEELIRASQSERLSPAAASGMRITLRTIRESILNSHDVFAGELVARTRGRAENSVLPQADASQAGTQSTSQESPMADPNRLGLRRQSLRSTIEKLAD
jgi:hypothetical protein